MALIEEDERVLKYERYINNVLKEDLNKIDRLLQPILAEVADLNQQKHVLKIVNDKSRHVDGFKTQVNVGCNFFMEASVTDTSTVVMNIGLNHYLEFTVEEADKYLDLRIKAFEKKAKELKQKAAETKGHIKLMLFGVNELRNVLKH